ncbi:nitroreductase [Rhizobiales bacterium]|uniref:Acg family FMN-binding oxidoreductase n=1 Tax=Hongsoonwoonella zoysiae TaxID=2821844 RepID=UPI001560F09C|nr:nitroreductase [Hongsoonwoonella zoysiae]
MLDSSLVERLIEAAIHAPSSHNTQPWKFEVRGDRVRLHADRTRALPVNDPDGRELVISCGCALMNLRAAAASEGFGTSVATTPDTQVDDALAEVSFSGKPDKALATLAKAIALRRTFRKRFAGRGVPDDIVKSLQAAAEDEGAWLLPLQSAETRNAAGALVVEGARLQWADPSWRRELARWMRPRHSGDGLTLPWLVAPLARIVVRTFDMGSSVGAKDRELAINSPLLAVLGTAGDGVADRLAAGQALERVLLAAASVGLQASYLNEPVQVALLRPKLADLCGHGGRPQCLLRLGYTEDDVPMAPRRPFTQVLVR